MTHILVFGDSIAGGAWDYEGGWVERLRMIINRNSVKAIRENAENDYNVLYNLSINSSTSQSIIKRLKSETKARDFENEKNIIIFDIGTNDCAYMISKKNNIITAEVFEKNLRELANIAGKIASKIVFLGITPVDEKKTDPIPWAQDIYYKNEHIKQYNNIISKICAEKGAKFIDVFELFCKSDPKRLLEDGVHPNTEGHKIIFEIVKRFLEEKGII